MRNEPAKPYWLTMNRKPCWLLAELLLLGGAWAENLLPNASFDEGKDQPTGWSLTGGRGGRGTNEGRTVLVVQGNGNDQSLWRTANINLKPGSLYRLSFTARRDPGASGGAAIAGPSWVNRDFRLSDSWQRYSFVFSAPASATNDVLRLGQWHVPGRILFDDAELLPVMTAHSRFANRVELGEGESIRGGTYRFKPDFDWTGANYHRPLFRNRAAFNSNRWSLGGDSEVVYRLTVDSSPQSRARLHVVMSYHAGGVLRVDASPDNRRWLRLAALDAQHRDAWSNLPAELFPAREIFIRLALQGNSGSCQVNTFEYEAQLVGPPTDADGATYFIDVLQQAPQLAVSLRKLDPPDDREQWQSEFILTNVSNATLNVRASLQLDTNPAGPVIQQTVAAKASGYVTVFCPEGLPGAHALTARIEDETGRALFVGKAAVLRGFLRDRRAGYRLQGLNDLAVWWCEGTWKVGRERQPPPLGSDFIPVSLSAARAEYESAQVILRPERDGELVSAQLGPLRDARGETGPVSSGLCEIAYVHVTKPSDAACVRGWYPDPLPPLHTPLALRGGQNQPLWVTFYVPPDAKAGDFRGDLEIQTTIGTASIPVLLHVYDFALPEQTHLKSALGLVAGAINQHHRLWRQEDIEAVYQKYLLNFAEHRLSPLSFYAYDAIDVHFASEGTNWHARLDFSRFDRAAKLWLDEHHFNTLRLPLLGMPSRASDRRLPGELGGFKQGSREYDSLFRSYLSQLIQHLEQRQWLPRAYAYWIDEPTPKDYDLVVEGMEQLKAAAPRIKRMLTATPDPKLIGHVDLWCGLTYKWTLAQMQERRAAGEEIWWYLATVPKAPYVTEFIDHPGTELRLWPWQSWQYGVSGILLWNTVYWTSALVHTGSTLQDPWSDPMSYASGSGLAPGFAPAWGNGDGRFLYPPRQSADPNSGPLRQGPVNSLRWENLRDGMEDYEYFWLLQRAVERAAAAGANSSRLTEARRLLVIPPEVSLDLTHFTTDPRPMLAHRDRVARMIEQLQDANSRAR